MNKPIDITLREVDVERMSESEILPIADVVAVEEPLEIRIAYGPAGTRMVKRISVTMRTPGEDVDLAVGFLFTEGILSAYEQVSGAAYVETSCSSTTQNNIIQVDLREDVLPQLQQAERNFYTTSSCGVCGKGSIEAIKSVSPFPRADLSEIHLQAPLLWTLSEQLLAVQQNFGRSGGIHASALFDMEGQLLLFREDVGRHNALDKVIGHALQTMCLPLDKTLLLLSGRTSFELIQKAAMAGIQMVVAIGAPSTLAIETAKQFDITLLGFLRQKRCNIYHLGSHTHIHT